MYDHTEYMRKYRKEHPEKTREASARWRERNPDKVKEANHKQYLKRKEAERERTE